MPVNIPGMLETSSLFPYLENHVIVTSGTRWPLTINVLQKLEIFLATEA